MADMCTLLEVKQQLELTSTDHDELISSLISAASAAIPARYQREFIGPTGGTRTFAVDDLNLDLAPYDLRSVSAVVLNPEESPGTLTANADYVPLPVGQVALGDTWQRIRFSPRLSPAFASSLWRNFGFAQVSVAGDWGIASDHDGLDASLRRACALTVASWLDRAIDAYASGLDDGREIRPDFARSWAIPAAAHSILQPWGRI